MPERADAARGVDPRGIRFTATITAVLLLLTVLLGSTGLSTAQWPKDSGLIGMIDPDTGDGYVAGIPGNPILPEVAVTARILDPAFLLLAAVALLHLWGVLSPRTQPWSALYRAVLRPRLGPPADLEAAAPPRFAQGVGLVVASLGLALHLLGVPWALPLAAAAAFIASFLNAVFGVCIGCQLYLVLQRAGIVGRARPAHA